MWQQEEVMSDFRTVGLTRLAGSVDPDVFGEDRPAQPVHGKRGAAAWPLNVCAADWRTKARDGGPARLRDAISRAEQRIAESSPDDFGFESACRALEEMRKALALALAAQAAAPKRRGRKSSRRK